MSSVPIFDPKKQLSNALILLSCVVITGTAGLVVIEQWPVWRALYFTLITITTVGYGDEGISDAGKRFATLLLVGGIATASYTFALVVQVAVSRQLDWRRRMQKSIDGISAHAIVCGFGRMGRTVCKELAKLGVQFVIIEQDEECFRAACHAGYLAVQGSGGDDDVLLEAGIERATHVVSVVDADSDSIVIALSARELNPSVAIISRADSEAGSRKLRLAGVHRVISPYQSGGLEIATAIAQPRVADFLARTSLEGSDLGLADVNVQDESPLVGMTLAEYGKGIGTRVCFVALERAGERAHIPPRGTVELQGGDHLLVAGDPDQIAEMRERASVRSHLRAA